MAKLKKIKKLKLKISTKLAVSQKYKTYFRTIYTKNVAYYKSNFYNEIISMIIKHVAMTCKAWASITYTIVKIKLYYSFIFSLVNDDNV